MFIKILHVPYISHMFFSKCLQILFSNFLFLGSFFVTSCVKLLVVYISHNTFFLIIVKENEDYIYLRTAKKMEECVYRSQMPLLPAKVNRSHNSGTEIVVKDQTWLSFYDSCINNKLFA